MNLARSLLALTILLAMTACFQSTTLIKVRPDGSGTLVETTTMSAETAAMFKQMMAGLGGEAQKQEKPPELFSEKEAKEKAAKLGEGVAFVKSEPIKTEKQEGIRATYSFKDINKLRISEKPEGPGAGEKEEGKPKAVEEMVFKLSKQANGNALLTVAFPKDKAEAKAGEKKEPPKEKPAPGAKAEEPKPEEIAQMKQMLDGLKFSVAVEVEGKLVKTNSPYVDKNTVTLIEMDFGKIINNEAKLKELSAEKSDQSMEQAKKMLKGIEGMKINLDPEVNIEFSK